MSGSEEDLSKGVAYVLSTPSDVRLSKGVIYALMTDITPGLLLRRKPPPLIDDEIYTGPLLRRRTQRPIVPPPPVRDAGIVFLDWSDDRGQSFGNPVGQSLGAVGEFRRVMQWQRLGMARDRVFRLTWACDSATALQGAEINVDVAKS